jgi:predicted RecA/RadA family phage recombinase
MNNYIQPGNVIDFVAAAALESGDPVLIGSRLGVCVADVASGSTGAAQIDGVFELPATTGETWTQGDDVYWNSSTSKLTTAGTGSTKRVAFAWLAKTSASTTGKVKLDRYPGSTGG